MNKIVITYEKIINLLISVMMREAILFLTQVHISQFYDLFKYSVIFT
jgi:hypothetical protein